MKYVKCNMKYEICKNLFNTYFFQWMEIHNSQLDETVTLIIIQLGWRYIPQSVFQALGTNLQLSEWL